jgi:protein TonB
MVGRMRIRLVSVTLLSAVLFADPATAKKKNSASSPTPAPAAPAHRDSAVVAPVTPSGEARTPGPLVRPGSPVEDRATIAPFPVPGDTGHAARELAKLMNVPREGATMLEPMPRAGVWKLSGSSLYWDPGGLTGPRQVDVLPQQLTEPAPEYPKAARDAGIQGVVLVMAWVTPAGSVGGARVVKSIPGLDDAAVQAVKRLRFKPASSQGEPVGVWVGIPVRFTIH